MIYDTFPNASTYFDKDHRISQALRFAQKFDLAQPDGTYPIDGENLYAKVLTYDTKPAEQRKFEAHKKYIDLQIALTGFELLDVSLDTHLQTDVPYTEPDDYALFHAPKHYCSLLLKPGLFIVLYPQDIHRPGCSLQTPTPVRKLVFKIRV